MNNINKALILYVTIIAFLTQNVQYAYADTTTGLKLQDVALPTDIKEISKQSGAIYYSSPTKNKILVPVHLWGHLVKPGLHFIPSETTFIKAVSATGGPLPGAKLGNVILTRNVDGKMKRFEFDLSDGGDDKAQNFVVQPGDVVFMKQDRFFENRAYYTSLISIAISLLTGVLLYREIQNNR